MFFVFQVIDLLNPNMRRYLQVRWSKNKGFYVENLFVVECETEDDLNAVLEEGRSIVYLVYNGLLFRFSIYTTCIHSLWRCQSICPVSTTPT